MPIASIPAALAACVLAAPPGVGDPFPAYLQADCVRGSMPSFGDPARPAVVAFVRLGDASSRRVLPPLDAAARRFGSGAAIIAIAEEPESDVRRFADSPDWSGRISFALAADPSRTANQAVFGPGAVPGLPTAFIVRGGQVLWRGSPADAETVLGEVAAGRWSIAEAQRAEDAQRAWDADLARIESLAGSGRVDEALSALDSACARATPAQAATCAGRRFRVLLDGGRVDQAIAEGERILASPAGARQGAGMAWAIARSVPGNRPALAFALRAASDADRAANGRDPMIGGVLARVQYLSGDRASAAATVRRVLPGADDPETRRSLQEDLGVYEPVPRKPAAPDR